jgi:hypothetical protein
MWQKEMRIEVKHAAGLTQPSSGLPYTTPSVFAALPYPDSFLPDHTSGVCPGTVDK